ncbi:hypothetical protein NDU88_007897 [Pleurodeles waltl]|uniref:Uncharacterized protein n=1 Tax=Pleurodeles waltl TaxID=8319 RepID=A0AAV7STT8_PLEWA|nr:hypothetical protein NDU88_007897 [Pleurodeles waltl]
MRRLLSAVRCSEQIPHSAVRCTAECTDSSQFTSASYSALPRLTRKFVYRQAWEASCRFCCFSASASAVAAPSHPGVKLFPRRAKRQLRANKAEDKPLMH